MRVIFRRSEPCPMPAKPLLHYRRINGLSSVKGTKLPTPPPKSLPPRLTFRPHKHSMRTYATPLRFFENSMRSGTAPRSRHMSGATTWLAVIQSQSPIMAQRFIATIEKIKNRCKQTQLRRQCYPPLSIQSAEGPRRAPGVKKPPVVSRGPV